MLSATFGVYISFKDEDKLVIQATNMNRRIQSARICETFDAPPPDECLEEIPLHENQNMNACAM